MNRIFLLIIFVSTLLFSSCGSMALTGDAKQRYLEKQKLEADAYAYAEVNCQERLIKKKMLDTRSDLTLRKQKNENFKFRLSFTKYIDAKFNGDTIEINNLHSLMEELGPSLKTCQEAGPVLVGEDKAEGDQGK